MTTEPDEDLVRWFGTDGARVVERALLRALRRAKADGQRAMMTSSAPRLSFSDGRRALVRATLVASAGTRREIARNSEGRSFHFEIRHVKSEGAAGKAIAHEAYIERESATEKLDTASAKHQGYLENDEKLETVGQPSAFGTIGDTLKQRQRFWKAFARSLKPRSRVQHRIIASLPMNCPLEGAVGLSRRSALRPSRRRASHILPPSTRQRARTTTETSMSTSSLPLALRS